MDVTSYILLTRRTRPNSITLILLFNVVQVSCEDGISKKVKSAYKLKWPIRPELIPVSVKMARN